MQYRILEIRNSKRILVAVSYPRRLGAFKASFVMASETLASGFLGIDGMFVHRK
jgi:hypothetical protein